MSREQALSPAVARESKGSVEKIHAPGKLGRVRVIDQELSIAISLGSTLLSLLAFRATDYRHCSTIAQRVAELDNKRYDTRQEDIASFSSGTLDP